MTTELTQYKETALITNDVEHGGLTAKDLEIARAALLQPTSPDLAEYSHLRAGQYINSVTKETLEGPFAPLFAFKQYAKFTPEGKFLMQIGHHGVHNGSNDIENFWMPTRIFPDPAANEVYISDGYGNRRVIVFDADTGKFMWRFWSIPAPGEPGSETWKDDHNAWKTGGGGLWQTGSYDPELDLMYWGTGNASPWNTRYRGKDSLYSASVIAVRPKTGEIAWHYQFTPDDSFDFDGVNENVIADIKIDGALRKVILHADRNGFFYVIDRTNGKLLRAFPFGKVNWASHVDLKTGRPVETDIRSRLIAGEEVLGDEERLREPLGLGLHRVLDVDAPLAAIAQQFGVTRGVLRGGNEQHLTNPTEHERGQWVVNQRFVINRHELFADGQGQRVQAGA